tara:strand:+ start:6610 stop:6969 length:360 start_codon:yes stop_codon:yes gene_type:complete
MIGSKIRGKIINHNWTFKALMNMDDAIRMLIDDMDISTDEMVGYLGDGWQSKIYDAFQSKIIPEMKSYLIDILDDASVNLPKQVPNTGLVEKIKPTEVIPEDERIAKLKEEIKKNTKQV